MAQPPPARRLAVVLSHPTQYYSPWFRWLQQHAGLTLRVFYLWDFGIKPTHDPRFGTTVHWDVDLLGGYDSEFVPNAARVPGAEHFWGFNNPELPARLRAWQPDVVLLFGYAWATHLRTIAWARRRRVPVIFRGDSHFIGRTAPGGLRRWTLRWLFRQFAAFAVVGAANRDYYRALGVPERKLFSAPHAVNAEHFNGADPRHRRAAADLRRQLQIADTTRVFLFAGKLVPAKQPRELLDAFLALKATRAALVFVGEGSEKNALVEIARAHPKAGVHFLPFANQSEMPSRYALADVFVLPSRGSYETWGLAINEAMHMGVPCLVSDHVGCQRDLVTDGETGWVFRAGDSADLVAKLSAALAADLAPFRSRIATRIAGYTYATATAGLLEAIDSVLPDFPNQPRTTNAH